MTIICLTVLPYHGSDLSKVDKVDSNTVILSLQRAEKGAWKTTGPSHKWCTKNSSVKEESHLDHISILMKIFSAIQKRRQGKKMTMNAIQLGEMRKDVSKVLMERLKKKAGRKKEVFQKMIFH